MIKFFLTRFSFVVCFFTLIIAVSLKAQQTVFTDNFNAPGTPQNSAYKTSGPIESTRWTVSRNGQDFGARIFGNMLTLSNDVSAAGNNNGWVSATTSNANIADYNPILSKNAGIVSWTFNMRQSATPSGFNDGNYGVAFILAGTPGSNNVTGKGYAIQLGGSSKTIRFVRYENGLKNYYTYLSSKNLGNFSTDYISIRVEYNPANNEWALYGRKDGSAFQDPKVGTLTFQERLPYSNYVNESLTIMGAYWNAGKKNNQTAFFDNISISVQSPQIISLDPDSKIAGSGAFTMTVNGKGFLPTSQVQWKGQNRPTTYISPTKVTAAIPDSDLILSGTANVHVKNNTLLSNTAIFDIEPSGAPILTLSKNILIPFNTVRSTASTKDSYTIKGDNLNGGATLKAPSPFEISLGTSTTYSNSLVLPNTGGGLTGQPLTINVRVASDTAGIYSGNISNSANGAVTKLVAVSAKVLALEPTNPATAVNFTDVVSRSITVNWTNGNGSERIVVIKEAGPVDSLPVDGTTYNGNSVFGTGSELGTGNFVIYKGVGTSVIVNGLNPLTNYHVSVIEFNGATSVENYRSAGAVNSTTTLSSPAGLQIKQEDTSYKIDFDNTVEGVNMGRFEGVGIEKVAQQGKLDSDSWAFSGFSSGPLNFGDNSIDYSSYENGNSDGEVDVTGIYAFNVGDTAENRTLGIKPGGADFNPGSITLRVHNRTSSAITSLNIGYKVYVKNVEESSTKVSFSHKLESEPNFSSDITEIDVVSESTADLNPKWKASYRVVTLTGLNIPADKYYNLKWAGLTGDPTAAQDEFGIDDIEVIANPTTNTIAFEGAAEDFVLAGNASLSDDLSVQNRLLFNGGKLDIKDKTLTIAGKVENTSINGLIGGASSKLVVRGTQNPTLSFDQSANTLKALDLFGANANTVTLSTNIIVNDSLKINELQTLNLGINALYGTLNNIINNGIILTQNNSTTPFTSGKTWNGTGILNMNATSTVQTLVAGTYNNLTLSSTAGTTAAADVTVNGILDLPTANASATKGSLDMGVHTLVMGPDGTNTGIGDVTGIIRRNSFTTNKLYTFGHPNSSIIFPGGGITLPTTMSAKLTIGVAPTWRTGAIQRQFDIIQTGAVGTKAIIRQHYLDSELNGNVESKLVFWANKIGVPTPVFDQGRSNNNTTENWVEISNANVGLYFTNTFDQVYITLDETSGADLVWNGSESTSWNTGVNWTPNGTPNATTKVTIPNVAINRYPVIDPTAEVKSISIEAGALVNTPAGSTMTVFDGAGAWQNNGTFNPGTGTVIFNNLDATISGTTTFNNLTIASGAGLRALEGNYMSIDGALTNNGTMFTTLIPNTIEFKGTSQTIPNVNGLDFGGYHNLIVSGNGTTTLAPSISTLNVRGNLTLNQPLNFAGKTVNMAGVPDQTIGGTAAIGFNDLIVNKETGAVNLAQDISVGGTLTLTKGNVVIKGKNLTLGSNAVAGTFNTSTMIVADSTGLVRRPFAAIGSYLFPIGELSGAASYSPIIVNVTAGSFSNAFVGVNGKKVKHPDNNSSQTYLRQYWNVLQTGITGAVATITGTYDALDVIGVESEIAAAQLKGTFNVNSNPWKKFGALANKTLVAKNAILTADVTSVFSGIKDGAFSVEVYGYGDFCLGSNVQIEAVVTNGDAPFTYIWSNGLPDSAIVTIPTSVVGTTDYTITVVDANGLRATDNNIPIDILPQSVGGTISNSSQEICAGSQPGDLILSGSVGKILYWQKSTDINFTANTESTPNNVTNISNFTTTLPGSQIGPINQTTYFRAVLQNGDCGEQYSSIATVTVAINTWNGTTWSEGFPGETNKLTSLVFAANYDTSAQDPLSATIYACNFQVNAGVILTINEDTSLKIENGIINNGSIIVESDGNLIQINDDALNTGNVLVKRQLSFKDDERKEYNYLISPVVDGNLKTALYRKADGITQVTAPSILYHTENNNRFYNSSGAYIAGRSLAVQEPSVNSGATNIAYFEGKPFNGKIAYNLAYSGPSLGYNLVGNPYPSNLDVNKLFADNRTEIESTFRFWDNTVNNVYVQQGSGYSGNAYAIFNALTGTEGTGLPAPGLGQAAGSSLNPKVPNNIVKIGQGFMVRALATGKILQYRNDVRSAVNGGSVFYGKLVQEDRYWLQMTAPSGITSTTAMVYFEDGNNLFGAEDSRVLNNSDLVYSIVQNEKIGINGRSNFTNADSIPLGTQHFVTGNYTISLGIQEGIFSNGQNIYLKDKQTNTITNLSEGNYTFNVNSGAHTGRFEIVYQSDIVLVTDSKFKEGVVVYRDHDDFVIKSPKVMSMIQVYDVSGKLVTILHPHNKQSSLNAAGIPSGMYVLKIITIDGEVINKKISR